MPADHEQPATGDGRSPGSSRPGGAERRKPRYRTSDRFDDGYRGLRGDNGDQGLRKSADDQAARPAPRGSSGAGEDRRRRRPVAGRLVPGNSPSAERDRRGRPRGASGTDRPRRNVTGDRPAHQRRGDVRGSSEGGAYRGRREDRRSAGRRGSDPRDAATRNRGRANLAGDTTAERGARAKDDARPIDELGERRKRRVGGGRNGGYGAARGTGVPPRTGDTADRRRRERGGFDRTRDAARGKASGSDWDRRTGGSSANDRRPARRRRGADDAHPRTSGRDVRGRPDADTGAVGTAARDPRGPNFVEKEVYDGPPLDDEITGRELDRHARAQLQGLPEKLANRVARHLVAAARSIDDDPDLAYQHTLAARARAARVPVVREATGEAAYASGRYREALQEFRAARRLNGDPSYLAMMADCERALGRPARAITMSKEDAVRRLDDAGQAEMMIVAAGARRDLGQLDAAIRSLEGPRLTSRSRQPWVARIRYVYADLLAAAGRAAEAREWFERTVGVDYDRITDAEERLAGLDIGEA